MPEGAKEVGRRRGGRPTKPRQEDGHEGKLYPYSIQATIRSVRKYGHDTEQKSDRTPEEFVEDTRRKFELLTERYRGQATENPVHHIKRIEAGQDLRWFDQKYFAECMDVPTALFAAFTHLVGEVARDGDESNAVNFLDSMIAALEEMRRQTKASFGASFSQEFLFIRGSNAPKLRYDVNLHSLRTAAEAYTRARDPRARRNGLVG